MTVSIVIPVFNRWPLTKECLRSLAREAPAEHDVELVVVDNGSTDATATALSSEAAAARSMPIQVIANERNLGFAEGCNAGAFVARGDVIVLLNNDMVALPGWLPELLKPLDDPTIGLVGALLWYPGRIRTVQHAGMAWISSLNVIHLYRYRKLGDEPGIMRAKDLQCVTGACMAIRREHFEKLGGFDTAYYNSFEDVDLCFRVRRDLGLRVRYEPRAQLIHHESQTPGRFDRDAENGQEFLRRWGLGVDFDAARIEKEDRAAGPA